MIEFDVFKKDGGASFQQQILSKSQLGFFFVWLKTFTHESSENLYWNKKIVFQSKTKVGI